MRLHTLKLFDFSNYTEKKYIRFDTYANLFLNYLLEIVNIEEFEKKTNIFYDSAQAIKLTQGICGIAKHGEDYVLVFNIAPTNTNKFSKGMFNTSLRMMECNGSYFHDGELITKSFIVNKDIVLWWNDAQGYPEHIIEQLAEFMAENDTSLLLSIFGSRDNKLFECEDETEKKQFEKALENVRDGKHGIIIKPKDQNPYLKPRENISTDLTDVSNSDKIQYLSHLYDDMLKRYGNMYGCSTNQTSKQAQQSVEEINGLMSMSFLRPVQLLKYSQKFCEDMKEVFDIDLSANFGIILEMNWHKFENQCSQNDNDENVETENVSRETLEKEGEEDERDSERTMESDENRTQTDVISE